jgi:proline dehydrogenase
MELLNKVVLTTLSWVPTPVMRRLAGRYIAGETLAEALERLAGLARDGHPGILDILGERVRDEAAARAVVEEYVLAARAVAARGLDAYVSVKPTHVGLHLSEALCLELYTHLAETLGGLGLFLRVEMEEATTVDATLRVYEALRRRFAHVGVVLQSRLFRTPADIDRLASGPLDVRIVKGIYLEPAEIAHTEPEPIREAYVACVDRLAAAGAKIRLATHDEGLAARCFEVLARRAVPAERWELQVLLGVQERLWRLWKAAGHTVRVYVPFGPEWRAYSTRRLRKNPQILGHVVRGVLGLDR